MGRVTERRASWASLVGFGSSRRVALSVSNSGSWVGYQANWTLKANPLPRI
ncbi:hypothetical protein I79_002085 [Cricetulus griseus]|uniref:Uncharacterized protein n=1 Tax=Cricetulus griseus TaxID=10029 RepID=G3GWG2_CRIGR|nr:hypothetical protein I79_002085 [Cricetulus griseus]